MSTLNEFNLVLKKRSEEAETIKPLNKETRQIKMFKPLKLKCLKKKNKKKRSI